ncbi:MAG: TonB-dependent receptor [Verrucomicrobia bacterium]|nr:TonB-dependent receptor [Verrucomicrobiota bacterium]
MSRYRTVMRVVGLATCIAGGAAGVQAAPEVLPEVVVTASREVEEAGEVMHSVEVVEGEEFVEKGYRTVPEALEQTPGVSVQKTTHGHGSPFIRGFTGRQNLLLVDGIRMNNSTYRGGPVQYWNTLDGFAMERMELVKSQGSVLYGSDALGGTLNVLSRGSGFEAEGPGMFWGGTGFYQYRTNGESQVGRLETRFGEGGKWGVLLGVTGKDFGDIRDDAVGLMRHTGYPEQDVDFKFEMLVDPDVKVTLAHQYLNQDEVYRWHSTVFNDVSWNGTATGTFPVRMYDQERSLSYLRFEGANGEGFVQNWSATVSYQKTQESEHQDRSPTDRRLGVVEVETYGLDVQMESAVGGGSLVYGVDYYEDHIDAVGWRTGKDPRSQRPMADDSEYRLGGVFAQYRRPVSERFELAGGVRYTRAEVELGKLWDGAMDVSARDEWDSVVFNVRGLYRPSEAWSIYGGASQGFRAPNVDDLSGNLTSRSGLDSMGSLDLSPEKTWTFELGTRVENAAWEVGGAVFYTLVDDLITTVPVAMGSSTVVSTNAQDAEIYGVELDAAWRFAGGWTLSGFVTWQEGESETPLYVGGPVEEQWVSRLSPLRGSVALRYDAPDERWWVEGRVIAADKADKLSEGDKGDTQRIPPGGTPGYVVASLRGGWEVSEDVSLTLGLENLTDEDYRIHGSGVNESGFGAVIGARVGF